MKIASIHDRSPVVVAVALTVLLLLAPLIPGGSFFQSTQHYLPLHTAMEFFAMSIAAMVFSVGWNAFSDQRPRNFVVLACGFLAVALLDFAHAISFEGMPIFVTMNDIEKTIYFWLVARLMAAVSLLALILLPWRPFGSPRARYVWLAISLAIVILTYWIGLYHADILPRTFIAGKGLTPFKVGAEYTLFALHCVVGVLLLRRHQKHPGTQLVWLACATWVMGLSELFFTAFKNISDLYNVFGHVYKVIGYAMVYRAIFVHGVEEPYLQLHQSQQELLEHKMRLELTQYAVDNSVDMIFWSDNTGRFLSGNMAACHRLGYSQEELCSLSVWDINPTFSRGMLPTFWQRLRAEKGLVMESFHRAKSGESYPVEISTNHLVFGEREYACSFVRDISARRQAEEQVRLAALVFDSSQEMVIITDKQMCTLRVNKAFTQISGYEANEAIGNTPRLLRSGKQDQAFYIAMWSEINTRGYWHGELWNRHKNGNLFAVRQTISALRDTEGKVVNYVSVANDITLQMETEERIRHLAYFDALTDLPNRVLVRDRAEQAIALAQRRQGQVALLFLDLDHFKTVNDSLGHVAGDELLKFVAHRIRQVIRDSDTLGRLGGDEFLLVVEGSATKAAMISQKILDALGSPHMVSGRSLTITTSIGISIYPQDADNFDSLLKNADIAMYKAKDMGRGGYYFYTREMNEAVTDRLALESGLHQAVKENQFTLHYQPQIEISTGGLVGMEALIRWNSPLLGQVSPAKFIPVAEDCGLILQIGSWVINEACRQLSEWASQGLHLVPVSVNVSSRQFRIGNIGEQLRQACAKAGISPTLIDIEITESLLVQNVEATLMDLKRLRDIGVRISVDDFGTGYSSLAYLKRFPIDRLKIDQSFVRDLVTDPDDRAISSGVINLGHSLGMVVVAEGVETLEQCEILRQLGADHAQGYFFSRPIPADQMKIFLQNHG